MLVGMVQRSILTVFGLAWGALLAVACSDPAAKKPARPDVKDASEEAKRTDALSDVTRCTTDPKLPIDWMSPGFDPLPAAAGTDADERALASVEEAAFAADDIMFWATYDQTDKVFRLKRRKGDELRELVFRRSAVAAERAAFDILSGQIGDFFPSVDPLHLADREALYEAYTNPQGVVYSDWGYLIDEPRMGFLNEETTAYPLALERLASLFSSPHAPDVIVDYKPDSKPGPGTHGSLEVLQSRASLVLGGAGVHHGIVLDDTATLADIGPTVLAALGAPTTSGKSLIGTYEEGLYLKRQDGRVLREALVQDACADVQHAVIVVLDGLMASELNHQLLSNAPDVELGTMRKIASKGVVYRGGAISPWPSFSAPGHMTVGTGVWSGHHGILSNTIHDRETRENINIFGFISDPQTLLNDNGAFLAMYKRLVNPEVETLAQAIHRGFGPWDPNTQEGAFVAVLNDLPILGADLTSFDLLNPTSARFSRNLDLTSLADDFAVNQALSVLEDKSLPVPKLMQLSLYTSDVAGQDAGPHSDLLRKALVEMDRRIAELRDAYQTRGAGKNTLWILVGDHGMALQDSSRPRNFGQRLTEKGVKAWLMTGMLYLRTLALDVSVAGLKATVHARDHGNQENLSQVAITCSGCSPASAVTDADGKATFSLPPGALVEFKATHPEYNAQETAVGTPFTE